jgi:exopolysaccharide biosynthesis protein
VKGYITILLFTLCTSLYSQNIKECFSCQQISDCLEYCTLKEKILYDIPQEINILVLPLSIDDACFIDLAFERNSLTKTSDFSNRHGALAAINGGFFDIKNGKGIHYLEYDHKTIHPAISFSKNSLKDSTFNSLTVVDSMGYLRIEYADNLSFYPSSNKELLVLSAGPMLLKNGNVLDLPNSKFVRKRHPRTCIGFNERSIYMITIDGRRKSSKGMNLLELQDFLLDLGLTDAMNLDGGGSTTMYLLDSIINQPSDLHGERKVANALLIKSK